MKTISRLYPPEAAKAEAHDVGTIVPKPVNEEQAHEAAAPPPPREIVRGRFVIAGEETETAYRLDTAEVMSVMSEAAPTNQSARFAELAMRERARQVFQRRFARRMTGRLPGSRF